MIRFLSVLLVGFLGLGWAAASGAEPTKQDWLYLQRVHTVSQLNEQLWRSVEKLELPDAEIARFARKSAELNRSQLERWGAPTQELMGFHRELISLLRTMEDFYAAVGADDHGRAQEVGARIQQEMLAFESSMQSMAKRYE